jgi:hypothetical protein
MEKTMKKNGFDYIFYGLIFILINIPVGYVDILPDFIGYTLLYFGYDKLKQSSPYFAKVQKFILLLLLISLVTFYRSAFTSIEINDTAKLIQEAFIGFITYILIMINFYDLFHGIKDLADKEGFPEISLEASRRWKLIAAAYILSFLMSFAALALLLFKIPDIVYLAVFFLLMLYISIMVRMMKFIRRCGKTLNTDKNNDR